MTRAGAAAARARAAETSDGSTFARCAGERSAIASGSAACARAPAAPPRTSSSRASSRIQRRVTRRIILARCAGRRDSCGGRARRRRSAKAPPRPRTGGTGSAQVGRHRPVTATASPPGYAEDFRLFAGLGLTHHRLSIEWARLEPERGVHDPRAVAHYRAVLAAARDAGVAPWVVPAPLHAAALVRRRRRLPRRRRIAPTPGRATSTAWPRRSAISSAGGSR